MCLIFAVKECRINGSKILGGETPLGVISIDALTHGPPEAICKSLNDYLKSRFCQEVHKYMKCSCFRKFAGDGA